MVKAAPKEEEVYKKLVNFLGDALDKKTLICAHNAKFDMSFLSETLKNLGCEGIINYVDTLSILRSLIPGLNNYKQNTVAKHLNIINKESHRAVTDAEVCGQILWQLIRIKRQYNVIMHCLNSTNKISRIFKSQDFFLFTRMNMCIYLCSSN